MMALVNFVGSTPSAQLVFFAKKQLHANDARLGLLQSAGSTGMILLSLAAGSIGRRWPFSRVVLGTLMLCGWLIVALALTRSYRIAVPIVALCSGLSALFNINTGSLRQGLVPNHMLGRVVSIAGVIAFSAVPLGTCLGGIAIERTHDVALVYAAIGILQFLIAFAFTFTAVEHTERYLPQANGCGERGDG